MNELQDHHDAGEHAPRRSLWTRLRATPARRAALSVVALATLVTTGAFGTQATFADDVTMATVTVTGGSLALTANGGDGPNEAWAGGLSTAVTGLQPGDERSGTVEIDNAGDLPFTITGSSAGTDPSGCYSFWFRETAAAGATRAASWPVTTAGFGTAAGSDAAMAPFATAVDDAALLDVTAGGDAVWEPDDSKTYSLTVRMRASCTTNAASGTLDIDLAATQA